MVVVQSDKQMFYNTGKEEMFMGEEGYGGKDDEEHSGVPSPDKHREEFPEERSDQEQNQDQSIEKRNSHELEEDEIEREGFACPFCPSKFSWRSALMQHQEAQHREEQMFICDQCDRIFTDTGSLQRHLRAEHSASGGTRAHSCPECGKTFATSSGLKQHTHIHSSVKPFICEVCLKSYTQFSNLCRHKRMHADCRTQLKCATCGQMYTTITSLNKHRRFCHSASPLIGSSKHLSPPGIQPPAILPYSPPLIGLPPSALYQASLAQMWNANVQQALLSQSLGKAAMMPSPYLLGYPPLSAAQSPLYSALNRGSLGAMPTSESMETRKIGSFPPSWTSPRSNSMSEKDHSYKREVEEEEHSKEVEVGQQPKRMRVESVSPAASPTAHAEERDPSSPIDNIRTTKVPSFIHRTAAVSPSGPNPPPPRITSPANSLGHQDGRSAFSPPQVSPASSTKSNRSSSPRKPEEQPLDLTTQKTPSPPAGLLSSPISPLSSSFHPSDRFSYLLDHKKDASFMNYPSGYPTQLPSAFDPMYKVRMEQHHQQLAEHYSRSAALAGLATLPPANILGSSPAFFKYHNLPGAGGVRPFPFGGGVVYPTSSKDMVIRGGKDRYTCKYCGKLFPRSANLTRHLRTHTGEQPYSCKYCDRSFSISSNLQRHVRNIHNKEKPFRCPLCERCFGQQTNLDRHLKKHDHEQNGEVTTTAGGISDNARKPEQRGNDGDGDVIVKDVDNAEKESKKIQIGSPRVDDRRTPSPTTTTSPISPSPLRQSEPAQPLKIQYKIARGRSPLSSTGAACQSPPSTTKVYSAPVSPPQDSEESPRGGVEGEDRVHPFSYLVNGASSWDSPVHGIHKPKAILT